MISAILWKEYREQLTIWLALAIVVVGVVLFIPLFYTPEPRDQQQFHDALSVAAIALAWAFAMVSGGMLLAGEREAETQVFLDALPVPRLQLWLGKAVVGGIFVGLFLLLTLVLLAFLPEAPSPRPLGLLLVALIYSCVTGLGWGLYFSARSASVLSAVGLAILMHIVALPLLTFILALPLALIGAFGGLPDPLPPSLGLASLFLLFAPLPLSAHRYSGLDRQRRACQTVPGLPTLGSQWFVGLWLAWRQARAFALGLAIASLVSGFVLLVVPLSWPIFTVVLGCVCGVAAFLDEQTGPFRFLGEQRFPLTRFWLMKLGLRLVLALCGGLIALLPVIVAMLIQFAKQGTREPALRSFENPAMRAVLLSPAAFLFGPVIIGFSVGHLCGLLCRKPLVAMVTGLGFSLLLLGLWGPSLLSGGVYLWQVLSVPVVLLVVARLLLHARANDRLSSRSVVVRLIPSALVPLAVLAVGLGYRVVEVSDVAEPEDFPEWVASLPTTEQNQAGRLIRSAAEQLESLSRQWHQQRAAQPLFPDPDVRDHELLFLTQARVVLERGWPDGEHELAGFLEKTCEEEWVDKIRRASKLPLGVVEDPQNLLLHSRFRAVDGCRTAGGLLAARGLQLQRTQRDASSFVDNLECSLAMARNLSNNAPTLAMMVAAGVESAQLQALDRWLEELDGRPELLRQTLAILRHHADTAPSNAKPPRYADYLVSKRTEEHLPEFLQESFQMFGMKDEAAAYAELFAGAWSAPWERARRDRQLRQTHWGTPRTPRGMEFDLLSFGFYWRRDLPRLQQVLGTGRARREAGVLRVALRLYETEKKQPATALTQLVEEKYLARVPLDPFDGQPFRYRLSTGEEIVWEQAGVHGVAQEAMRKVPAGQGILWSAGEDGRDHGGTRQRTGAAVQEARGEDWIFLVPLPKKKER